MANQQSLLFSISSKTHDDLSNWELISDVSDDDSIFGVQSFDLDESIHSLSSSDIDDDVDINDQQQQEEVKVDNFRLALSNCDVNYHGYCEYVSGNDTNIDDHVNTHVVNLVKVDNFGMDLSNYGANYHGYCDYDDVHEHVHDDDDDDDSDDGDDDDMDDDLVPWEMKGIYMRERIKKSGKKSMVKLGKSKKVLKSVRKYGLIAY